MVRPTGRRCQSCGRPAYWVVDDTHAYCTIVHMSDDFAAKGWTAGPEVHGLRQVVWPIGGPT